MPTYGAAPALAAYLALAVAVTLADGHYDPFALALVGLACALTLAAFAGAWRATPAALSRALWLVAVLGSLDNLVRPVGSYVGDHSPLAWQLLWLALVLTSWPGLPAHRWYFPATLALAAALGVWLVRASPNPQIDVFTLHQEGARVLLSGESPYRLGSLRVGDTGLAAGGQFIEQFPYPPAALLAGTMAYAPTGDARYAFLICQLITAWGLARLGGRLGELAGLVWLTHPRGLFVLEQSWNEPLPLALLTLGTLAWSRERRRLAALAWGGGVAAKQYLVLLLPFLPLLAGFSGALLLLMALAGAATLLPFLMWQPRDLLAGLLFHLHLPARENALTLPAALGRPGLSLAAWPAVATIWLAACRRRWPLSRWLSLVALALLIFFGLARWAYCNYYYLIGGLLLLAVVTETAAPAWEAAPTMAVRSDRWRSALGEPARLALFAAFLKLVAGLYEYRALQAGARWMGPLASALFNFGPKPAVVRLLRAAMSPFMSQDLGRIFAVRAFFMGLVDVASAGLLYACLRRSSPGKAGPLTVLWLLTPSVLLLGPIRQDAVAVFLALLSCWLLTSRRPLLATLVGLVACGFLPHGSAMLSVLNPLFLIAAARLPAGPSRLLLAAYVAWNLVQAFFSFHKGCFLASLDISAAG